MKLTGENRNTRRKSCPSATFSTTNLTWTDTGSNPGLCGEGPATNRLSHGTALTGRRLCEYYRNNGCMSHGKHVTSIYHSGM
jgi:hypothetical protein